MRKCERPYSVPSTAVCRSGRATDAASGAQYASPSTRYSVLPTRIGGSIPLGPRLQLPAAAGGRAELRRRPAVRRRPRRIGLFFLGLLRNRSDLLRVIEVVRAAVELVLPVAGHASSRTGLPWRVHGMCPRPITVGLDLSRSVRYCFLAVAVAVRTRIPSPRSALGFVTIVAPSIRPSSTSTVEP